MTYTELLDQQIRNVVRAVDEYDGPASAETAYALFVDQVNRTYDENLATAIIQRERQSDYVYRVYTIYHEVI